MVDIVLALVVMVTVNAFTMSRLGGSVQTVDYSTFTEMVEKGQVEAVEIGSSVITFTTKGGTLFSQSARYQTVAIDDQYLVERLLQYGVSFAGEQDGAFPAWISCWCTCCPWPSTGCSSSG